VVVSREGFCFCLGSLGKLGEGRVSVSVGERGDCGGEWGCREYRSAASIERSMMWNFNFNLGVERDRTMKRTRRYSKNEKKKFNTEKKERNVFAPAPLAPKKTKPTSQAQKKKKKNNRIVPPSETHKLTNKAPRKKRRRDFFKAKEVNRTMRMRMEATYPILIPPPLLHRSIHWLARGVHAPGVEAQFHISWLGLSRGMEGEAVEGYREVVCGVSGEGFEVW